MNKKTKNKIAKIILQNFKDKDQAVEFIESFPTSLNGTICLNSFDSEKNLLTFNYQFYGNMYGYDGAIYGCELDKDMVEKTLNEIDSFFTEDNTVTVPCDDTFKSYIEALPSLDRFACDRIALIPFQLYFDLMDYGYIYDYEIEDNIDIDTDKKFHLTEIFEALNEIINDHAFDVFADIRDIIEESK